MKTQHLTTDQVGSEDLKGFERRLNEIMNYTKPKTYKWRIILALAYLCNILGAWFWLTDPDTADVPFLDSLWNQPLFPISCIILIILLAFGVHKKVLYSDIMLDRTRAILEQYNMSCDNNGALMLTPQYGANKFN